MIFRVAKSLDQALKVFASCRVKWEIIIVNDGSTEQGFADFHPPRQSNIWSMSRISDMEQR